MAILGGVGMLASVILGPILVPPLLREAAHFGNDIWPNEILDPKDIVELARRRDWPPEQVLASLKQHGLNSEKAQLLYDLTWTLMGIADLVGLHRRGLIDDENYRDFTKRSGIKPDTLHLFEQALEPIPNVTDIISFAVREVYNPDIVRRFGQEEGLKEVFKNAEADIKAQGMSEETFKKYWAAHWRLPAIQQGFEMLHRGVIDATPTHPNRLSLEELLVALDIMPGWREALTEISYTPYTRVDVRRMHSLGILSLDEVVKSYKDLGYDDEHAKNMAYFTYLYNLTPAERAAELELESVTKEKDLTKAEVLSGYKSRLLTQEKALDLLTALGYDTEEVTFYLARADHERESTLTRQRLSSIRNAYLKGRKTETETRDALFRFDTPPEEVNDLMETWGIEFDNARPQLSVSQLAALFKKKIIDAKIFVNELKRLGYETKYAGWLILLYSEA